MVGSVGVAISVLTETWDWSSAYRDINKLEELRNKLSALTNYKERIRKWYGEDIEDEEFEEI